VTGRTVDIDGPVGRVRWRCRGGTAIVLDKSGYTLIELIVVMVLVGLVFAFTAPRLRYALLTDSLKTAARNMVGAMTHLRNEAVSQQERYALHLDVASHRYWATNASMTDEEKELAREQAQRLPPDVQIRDVWIKGKGRIVEGEAQMVFTPRGYTQASAVHLRSQDGREITLELTPFMSQVAIFDTYVGYD